MKYTFIIIITFLLLGNIFCRAQSNQTLVITASNFSHHSGKAVVHLFRAEDEIPEKPFMKATAIIVDGSAKIIFKNIPYGNYAAILFHDENDNDILDHKWGFPHEPMGFSNAWSLSLFSGMPNFEKLKFQFSEHQSVCEIKVK